MKKPDILNPELENSVTEPKQEQFKSRLDITDLDAEQITGGCIKVLCTTYLQN